MNASTTISSAQEIASRVAVRQALWEKHLQNLVSAFEEGLRKTAAGGDGAEPSGEHDLNVFSH